MLIVDEVGTAPLGRHVRDLSPKMPGKPLRDLTRLLSTKPPPAVCHSPRARWTTSSSMRSQTCTVTGHLASIQMLLTRCRRSAPCSLVDTALCHDRLLEPRVIRRQKGCDQDAGPHQVLRSPQNGWARCQGACGRGSRDVGVRAADCHPLREQGARQALPHPRGRGRQQDGASARLHGQRAKGQAHLAVAPLSRLQDLRRVAAVGDSLCMPLHAVHLQQVQGHLRLDWQRRRQGGARLSRQNVQGAQV